MKVGKTAAFLIGSGILMLEVANEQGWIKVDWSKVTKQVDAVGDKVEEAVTGEGPRWMDKVCVSPSQFFFLRICVGGPIFLLKYPLYSRLIAFSGQRSVQK